MPMLETPNELAEFVADLLGIYSDPRCRYTGNDLEHVEGCWCRSHWVPAMAERIRMAVHNEELLEAVP